MTEELKAAKRVENLWKETPDPLPLPWDPTEVFYLLQIIFVLICFLG